MGSMDFMWQTNSSNAKASQCAKDHRVVLSSLIK